MHPAVLRAAASRSMVLEQVVTAPTSKDNSLLKQITSQDKIVAAAQTFASCESQHGPKQKLICVVEGEYAEADLSKEHVVLASRDATTCCIAALVAPSEQWALVTHIDARWREQLDRALLPVLRSKPEGWAQLYLVGGHGDAGEAIAEQVLRAMHALPNLTLDVQLAAVGPLNTDPQNGGILHRNLALNTTTGTASPSVLREERGPLLPQRSARPLSPTGTCMVPIYNNRFQLLHIAPVHMPLQLIETSHIHHMLAASDADLLEQSSTSPDQEAPGFCDDVRATMQWIMDGDGRRKDAAQFRWSEDSGGWVPAGKEVALGK